MKKVRLEIDFIEIERKRKRWNLYFIIATENPLNSAETLITTIPSEPIPLRKSDNNRIDFEPKGNGDDLNGLIALERELPEDNTIKTKVWVVQSRNSSKKASDILSEIGESTNAIDANSNISSAIGTTNPWIIISKSVLSMSGVIGDFLSNSKDSKKGFVNMDESFTTEEIAIGELDRSNRLSGFGEAGWTWIIED